MIHLHVIYVPPGRDARDVWRELCIFGRLTEEPTLEGHWATIRCDGDECAGIEHADAS